MNCVLVGFDPHISYYKIMKAASYLKRKETVFVATNEDTNLPLPGDIVIPGNVTNLLSKLSEFTDLSCLKFLPPCTLVASVMVWQVIFMGC